MWFWCTYDNASSHITKVAHYTLKALNGKCYPIRCVQHMWITNCFNPWHTHFPRNVEQVSDKLTNNLEKAITNQFSKNFQPTHIYNFHNTFPWAKKVQKSNSDTFFNGNYISLQYKKFRIQFSYLPGRKNKTVSQLYLKLNSEIKDKSGPDLPFHELSAFECGSLESPLKSSLAKGLRRQKGKGDCIFALMSQKHVDESLVVPLFIC